MESNSVSGYSWKPLVNLETLRTILRHFMLQYDLTQQPLDLVYEHLPHKCSSSCNWWPFAEIWVCSQHGNFHVCTERDCNHRQWEVDRIICEWTQQIFAVDLQDDNNYKVDPTDREFRKKNPRPETTRIKTNSSSSSSSSSTTTITPKVRNRQKPKAITNENPKAIKLPSVKVMNLNYTEECEVRREIIRILKEAVKLQHIECFGEEATNQALDWTHYLTQTSSTVGWTYIVEIYQTLQSKHWLGILIEQCLRTWHLVAVTQPFIKELKHKYLLKTHIWVVLLALGEKGIRISKTKMIIKPIAELQALFKVPNITLVFGEDVKPRVYTDGTQYFRDCFVDLYSSLAKDVPSQNDGVMVVAKQTPLVKMEES